LTWSDAFVLAVSALAADVADITFTLATEQFKAIHKGRISGNDNVRSGDGRS
jgi:hypothetical protein